LRTRLIERTAFPERIRHRAPLPIRTAEDRVVAKGRFDGAPDLSARRGLIVDDHDGETMAARSDCSGHASRSGADDQQI
jgi:hypothetical protein